jgi:uncharacterized iron-regulated membrane protein
VKARFRDSMNWLHTWAGLVVGWVLFAVFLTGTLAYFQHEISRWMQPELPAAASPEQAVAQAQQYLQQHAVGSDRWTIVLPGARGFTTDLFWRPAPMAEAEAATSAANSATNAVSNKESTKEKRPANRRFERASLAGDGTAATARETRGGQFFYRFHFDLYHLPVVWARWIVGVCSMLMLLALCTGIVIHKKIFKDFFTLQWRKGHKSWLDGHTLTSVLALPFHLMITYTGLITLMFMYMALAVSANFSSSQQFFAQLQGDTPPVVASGQPAAMVPLEQILRQAQTELQGADISLITVHQPGDAAAVIELREASTNSLGSGGRELRYSGSSGLLLNAAIAAPYPEQIRHLLINLHSGRFADPLLRWLYFLSGLAGTAMIGSGLILWSARRASQPGAAHFGHKLVHCLNGGTVLGLPLAVACFFWANRLLPLQWPDRPEWEIHGFFAGWLLMLLFSLLRNPKLLWRDGLRLLAAVYLLLPLWNFFSSDRHLGYSLWHTDWVFAGIDLVFLVTGLCCLQTARVLQRRRETRSQSAIGGAATADLTGTAGASTR